MCRLTLPIVFAVGLVAAMTAAPAGAVTAVSYDKLTHLTFSGSVQIPGVTLTAGTYRFRLANPDTSRNVIQVLSHDGSIVYAMFHTIPDSRMRVTEDATVTFRETPVGVPPAVRSLFYGGEHRGYEFVYPHGGPIMSMPAVPQATVTYTPLVAAAPEPVAPEPEPMIEAEPAVEPLPSEPIAIAEPAALPATASPLPLLLLGGLTTLLAGLGLRRWVGRRGTV